MAMARTMVLHLYLAMVLAAWAVSWGECSNATYHFQPPELPKPDFEFTFYMHDQLVTPTNRTAFAVTVPAAKVDEWTLSDQTTWLLDINSSFFGSIVVLENPLTVEPLVNSTQVGFGRGMYVFDKSIGAENENNGIEWLFTAIFTDESGLGNSTLSFRGWDYFKDSIAGKTELSISGGTGKFRLAKGYSRVSTSFIDAVSAAVKFDVSVFIH